MTEKQLQIRLLTRQLEYAVPALPLSVPCSINEQSLNQLVNELLKENQGDILKVKVFDFVVLGEILRVNLDDFLKEKEVSHESTVDIEYVERTPAPEPDNSIVQDDWVSSLHTCQDKWILTGCYDNSVSIFTLHGKPLKTSIEHTNIVKDIKWIDTKDHSKGFVSVSQDLTGKIWEWHPKTEKMKVAATLKGHSGGINTVAISPDTSRLVTGGWDMMLKIWSSKLAMDEEEPAAKKWCGKSDNLVRTPIHTLEGHKEAISSALWMDNNTIITASMDHTIKIWDAELFGIKNEILGQKAYFSCDWSPINNSLITTSADPYIRLYDPRSTEGSVCKLTFISHTSWISSVVWSHYNEHLFASGGYDSQVKLWDTRSPRAPLYDLQGHEGQVLKTDWSSDKYIISGGADNRVHIFKNRDKIN